VALGVLVQKYAIEIHVYVVVEKASIVDNHLYLLVVNWRVGRVLLARIGLLCLVFLLLLLCPALLLRFVFLTAAPEILLCQRLVARDEEVDTFPGSRCACFDAVARVIAAFNDRAAQFAQNLHLLLGKGPFSCTTDVRHVRLHISASEWWLLYAVTHVGKAWRSRAWSLSHRTAILHSIGRDTTLHIRIGAIVVDGHNVVGAVDDSTTVVTPLLISCMLRSSLRVVVGLLLSHIVERVGVS